MVPVRSKDPKADAFLRVENLEHALSWILLRSKMESDPFAESIARACVEALEPSHEQGVWGKTNGLRPKEAQT